MEGQRAPLPQLTGRVLFVDDDPALRKIFGDILEKIGCAATVCANGVEALDFFKQDPTAYDLVLTDQSMPGMTGMDLAVELVTVSPDLPIILLSGSVAELEMAAQPVGVREFLSKPILLAELAEALGRYLQKKN